MKEQQDDKEILQKYQLHDQQEWGEQTFTQQGEQEPNVDDFRKPSEDQEQELQQLDEQEHGDRLEQQQLDEQEHGDRLEQQQLDEQEHGDRLEQQQLDEQEQPFEEAPSSSGTPSTSSTTLTPPPLPKVST